MAIRPPKDHSQGFTLIEMLVTIVIAGIIMGFALPSFLSLNKPLRDGTLQMKSHLSLVRSKAIASSQAYRIRPKFATRAEYDSGIPRNFVVEYASNCKAPENNVSPVAVRWQMASQLDLDLPTRVGITDVATASFAAPVFTASTAITNALTWNVCFDNRGIVDTPRQFVLKDFQDNNKAKISVFSVGKLGIVDFYTYANGSATTYSAGTDLKDSQTPPMQSF